MDLYFPNISPYLGMVGYNTFMSDVFDFVLTVIFGDICFLLCLPYIVCSIHPSTRGFEYL